MPNCKRHCRIVPNCILDFYEFTFPPFDQALPYHFWFWVWDSKLPIWTPLPSTLGHWTTPTAEPIKTVDPVPLTLPADTATNSRPRGLVTLLRKDLVFQYPRTQKSLLNLEGKVGLCLQSFCNSSGIFVCISFIVGAQKIPLLLVWILPPTTVRLPMPGSSSSVSASIFLRLHPAWVAFHGLSTR